MANSISFMDVMCDNTFAVALKQVNTFWSYGLIVVNLNSFCLTGTDLFAVKGIAVFAAARVTMLCCVSDKIESSHRSQVYLPNIH